MILTLSPNTFRSNGSKKPLKKGRASVCKRRFLAQWEKSQQFDEACGLKLLSVDVTQFKTQNTVSNQHFGYATGSSNFPSVLAVTLMSTRTHPLSDAAFGPVTNSEISYVQQLIGSTPDNFITLFDRIFFSAELFSSWQQVSSNSHWLILIKKKMRYDIVESYSAHV